MPGDTTIEIMIDPSLLEHVTEDLARKKHRFQPEDAITFLVFSILDHLALPHPSKADRLMLRTSLAGSGGVRYESGTPQTCSKYGASAPFVSGDGGFQERRRSNSKAASGWPWKFPPSIGSSPSSRARKASGRLDQREMPR